MKFCFTARGNRVFDVLSGDTTTTGGAEAQTAYMAAAFASLGHQVDLIYGYGAAKSSVVAGVRCIDAYPCWQRPKSLLTFWAALKESAADLVYANLPDDFLWILGLYSKLHSQSNFVYHIRNDLHCTPWKYYSYKKWFHNPLYALSLRSADAIAVQHETQAQLVKPYIKADITLIPNFVRSCEAEPRSYKDTNIDAIWVASIRPQKQLHLFLDIAEALPHLKFAVVGWFAPSIDQEIRQDLEHRMQLSENLRYLGAQQSKDVLRLLKRSKLMVSTSNLEGFPNTMLEAWSVGVPIVSLEIDPGGVIQRKGIGLVSGTMSNMISDIERLAQTRSSNQAMGEKGLEYVRRTHSLEAVCQAFGRIMPDIQTQGDAERSHLIP